MKGGRRKDKSRDAVFWDEGEVREPTAGCGRLNEPGAGKVPGEEGEMGGRKWQHGNDQEGSDRGRYLWSRRANINEERKIPLLMDRTEGGRRRRKGRSGAVCMNDEFGPPAEFNRNSITSLMMFPRPLQNGCPVHFFLPQVLHCT